jgi:hypothetical protein
MKSSGRYLLVLGLVVTALEIGPAAGQEAKRKGKFTIGRETTNVTGPVDKDGYIDYAAALNKRLGQKVTPDQNANVLLWKAFGPHPEGATMLAEYFQLLGMPAPPEDGEYFVDLTRYLKEHLKIGAEKDRQVVIEPLNRVARRSWSAKEFPNLASWLKANDRPLATVVEATKRADYFSPLVLTKREKGTSGLIAALLPGIQKCRECATALSARAMLRVAQNEVDAAWEDLLACHRLGRLVARGGTLIEGLSGIAIDQVAGRADLAFLDRATLNAQQIATCLRDLQQLPPVPAIAEKVDCANGSRFSKRS